MRSPGWAQPEATLQPERRLPKLNRVGTWFSHRSDDVRRNAYASELVGQSGRVRSRQAHQEPSGRLRIEEHLLKQRGRGAPVDG